jgi:hypothetical protein
MEGVGFRVRVHDFAEHYKIPVGALLEFIARVDAGTPPQKIAPVCNPPFPEQRPPPWSMNPEYAFFRLSVQEVRTLIKEAVDQAVREAVRPPFERPAFLTIEQLAAIEGLSTKTILRRAHARAYKGIRGGGRGEPYRFRTNAIEKQLGFAPGEMPIPAAKVSE